MLKDKNVGILGKLGRDDNVIQLWQRYDGSLEPRFLTPDHLAKVKEHFSREDIEMLRKYFTKVDEVSTAGGNQSPSAKQRAEVLKHYLDNG